MHGGKGSGAPRGNRHAWKHGVRSGRIRAIARYLPDCRALLDSIPFGLNRIDPRFCPFSGIFRAGR